MAGIIHGFDYAQPHIDTMSDFGLLNARFIGTVLEGLFYGLYFVIFVLYIQVHTSKRSVDRNILIYPLSTLFILCTVYFSLDFSQQYLLITSGQRSHHLIWHLNMAISTIYSFVDFIAQGILIYRCWVVWNRRLLIVIIPSILALSSLATALALVVELELLGEVTNGDSNPPSWFFPVGVVSFSLSLAVNAIFTGLLVFKIAKTSQEFRRSFSHNTQTRNEFRPLMSMLIETGVVLFVIQLFWVIFFSTGSVVFQLIGGPITMLYGAIPTLIVVRAGMNNNFKDRIPPLESNMRFALADENSPTKISGNIFPYNSRLSRTMSVYARDDSDETAAMESTL